MLERVFSCEYFRPEDDNRGTAIGMHFGAIMVPEFPHESSLTFVVMLKKEKTATVYFRSVFEDQELVDFEADTGDSSHAVAMAFGGAIEYSKEGTFRIYMKNNVDAEWSEIYSVPVVMKSTTNVSSRHS